jgi:hypothetical protein
LICVNARHGNQVPHMVGASSPGLQGTIPMITQKILMQGTCRDARSVATMLTRINGVRTVAQAIESGPVGCEPEEQIAEDATVLHSLTVEVPDQMLATRVREVVSLAAEILDAKVRFLADGAAGSVQENFVLSS